MRKVVLNLLLILALLIATVTPAFAQDEPAAPVGPLDVPDQDTQFFVPLFTNGSDVVEVTADSAAVDGAALVGVRRSTQVEGLRVEGAVATDGPGPLRAGNVSDRLASVNGRVRLVVRLSQAPAARVAAVSANSAEAQVNAAMAATAQQQTVLQWLRSVDPSAKVLANLRVSLNAVVVETDASLIPALGKRPEVVMINPVGTYELDLSETVPYIGATAVQESGYTGAGVTVAVLDSGIDYTHFNLGGEGTLEAYEAAYGTEPADPRNTTRDGLFPTAKVVDGYDFVGEDWPNTDEVSDPDPIDWEGHGTHVADIIGGESTDGTHVGVAPGVSLMAVKVCSAVATSCSGLALLQGIEFAADPNGDGNMSDAVDVVNMSLGQSYGQFQDDLSVASANIVKAGVVVVASAGNSADRPYILGSPSSQPEVISVAQTQVPSAVTFALKVNSPTAIAGEYRNTETVEWAPIGDGFTGDVAYVGRGCPADSIGAGVAEDAYLADPAGKVALIDRGACSVSLKVDRAAKAGAIGVLIGLVAAGDAVSFSNGGGDTFVPTLIIIKSYADTIKAQLNAGETVNVTVSDAVSTALIGSMVGSSSRGPSYSWQAVKPDIGAPGASLSAVVGTGTGEEAFGGTSGAAPMVAGAAALVIDAHPGAVPGEVRARLMNNADTNIQINPATQPGVLAPITRIGAGEVRVDDAIAANLGALDHRTEIASLSFGYRDVPITQSYARRVLVYNFASNTRTLAITPTFRYADDAASGAVTVSAPSSIVVRGNSWATFYIALIVDPSKLPTWPWTFTGGSQGGLGSLLQVAEYDGYLNIGDSAGAIHLPWQIMPRKASGNVVLPASLGTGNRNAVRLLNLGVENGNTDVLALLGTSPRIADEFLPGPGDNFAVVDIRAVGADYWGDFGAPVGDVVGFGITTFGTRSHPAYPAEFDVYVDTTGDGVDDFVVYNAEASGFALTGQTLAYVADLQPGQAPDFAGSVAYFYADTDLNTANITLPLPLGLMGVDATTQLRLSVYAFDNYFSGALTDSIENMYYTPATPKYGPTGVIYDLPQNQSTVIKPVAVPGGAAASPSQTGLLMLHRNQPAGFEANLVVVK